MISIRHSISDLEKSEHLRSLVLDCYVSGIKGLAQYAVELDELTTAAYRNHVASLAREVETAAPDAISESRATLRGLLRDYHDKACRHVAQLREELERTASGLERLIDSMSQNDGDHESRLREAQKSLRSLAQDPAGVAIAHLLRGVADTIDHAIEQFRQQQQLATSQFLGEIHQLHQRIATLESEASKNDLTKLLDRSEIEARLGLTQTGGSLLLLTAQGLQRAAVQFGREVAQELAAAFVKRLRNNVPPEAMVGRWSEEEFLVFHQSAKNEALIAAKSLTQQLSGAYACVLGGKTVRPTIQTGVAVLEFVPGDQVERTLQKINQFFKG